MPLNSEAQFLSNNQLAAGLLENMPNRLQFLQVFPFYQIKGSSLTYVRTPALTFADTIGFCDDIPDHTKLPQEPVDFKMAELAAHFEISYKGADIMCETNDLWDLQKGLAIRQLLYRFSEQFEIGNLGVNPNTFNGLLQIADPAKLINLNCAPLTIQHLDNAKGMVRTNNGYAGVIITNQLGLEFIRKAHYNIGTVPRSVPIAVNDPLNGTRMEERTSFDGWVVYLNDKQPVIECVLDGPGNGNTDVAGIKMPKMKPKKGAKPVILEPGAVSKLAATGEIAQFATNIWFGVLGWNHLHGILPYCTEDSMFKVRRTIRPDNSKDVGHVVFPVGIALGSQCALSGILNATHPTVGPIIINNGGVV